MQAAADLVQPGHAAHRELSELAGEDAVSRFLEAEARAHHRDSERFLSRRANLAEPDPSLKRLFSCHPRQSNLVVSEKVAEAKRVGVYEHVDFGTICEQHPPFCWTCPLRIPDLRQVFRGERQGAQVQQRDLGIPGLRSDSSLLIRISSKFVP